MRCPNCNEVLLKDSVFCSYCGVKVDMENTLAFPTQNEKEHNCISETDRAKTTNNQRYFDSDFGFSVQNPIVVSSISSIGHYLSGFRTKDGNSFTWERGSNTEVENVDEYRLYLNGEFYKTVYFNSSGNDSEHMPQGIVLDKGAFDAAKRGLTPEQYVIELQEKLAEEENAKRIKLEEKARIEQQQREIEHKRLLEKEDRKRRAAENKSKMMKFFKKMCKTLLIVLILTAIVFSVYFACVSLGKIIKYNSASNAMDKSNYSIAIKTFEELGDYKDSIEKVEECTYLYAQELFADKMYDLAKEQYQKISSYKDSHEKITECTYLRANELFDGNDYNSAKTLYSLITDYNDSKEKVAECTYKEAVDLYDSNKFFQAWQLFKTLQNYKDSSEYIEKCHYAVVMDNYENSDYRMAYFYYNQFKKLSDSGEYISLSFNEDFISEIIKKYAEYLMEQENYITALELLYSLKSSEEVLMLIERAENGRKQVVYDKGLHYFNNADFINAVYAFKDIKDYKDAEDQWLLSMYNYVLENKEYFRIYDNELVILEKDMTWKESAYASIKNEHETFYKYAKELSEHNYKDSKDYYNKLTAWRVSVIMNNSDSDQEKDTTSISKWDECYAHITLTGGPFNGKAKLRYVFTMTDGSTVRGTWDDEMGHGDTGWCMCYFNSPEYARNGTCKVKIYDNTTDKILAEDQIRVIDY